jgi:cation diffusion facilitator CzcD-associated flavoprotein CzcO
MQPPAGHHRIVIVGAGFSGLGMAIRLKQQGIQDFVVLERLPEVGGIWQCSTFPGLACDVPSHLYSFSFAPNPDWSHTYAPQPQIRDYLCGCAEHFGVRPHVLTEVELQAASWSEERQLWEIDTSAGPFTANVLISGMGPLIEPRLPDVPGIDAFEGKTMHTARWDHDYELAGKRVASIGTGASTIQYVPEIQPRVEQLYVFQRTAPWVVPRLGRQISDFERRLFRRVPAAQRLMRAAIYLRRELLVLPFAKLPILMSPMERVAELHRRRQVPDRELRAKVTPDHALGCKRAQISNRWYPALTQPNVELVTGGLLEVRARSVVDCDGHEREVDAIIFGTGYHVTHPQVGGMIRGRGGRLMRDAWEGSPRAYLGTAVPGFPNLFLLLGPNTGLGHISMIYMVEAQVQHVLRALEAMEQRAASTIEVRERAFAQFNERVDANMGGTVWSTGCASYYIDDTGRNSVLWPDWTWRFHQLAVHFDADAYELGTMRRGMGSHDLDPARAASTTAAATTARSSLSIT